VTSRAPEARPIGILCALSEELTLLAAVLEDERAADTLGLRAWQGRLDGHPVVLAEAGVGKVNAAASATILCDRYGCRALVLSGVAGGISERLGIGDIVIADRVIDVDYGRVHDSGRVVYQPGSWPLPEVTPEPGYELPAGLRERLETALEDVPERVELGTIVTADTFLASPRIRDGLAASWSALAVEMEGSAVCGVAARFGVPWLIVRALSDRADEDSSVDFVAFLASAAAGSADLVRRLLPLLAAATR
jgi:adenosylhomocysteine nucleosidase